MDYSGCFSFKVIPNIMLSSFSRTGLYFFHEKKVPKILGYGTRCPITTRRLNRMNSPRSSAQTAFCSSRLSRLWGPTSVANADVLRLKFMRSGTRNYMCKYSTNKHNSFLSTKNHIVS
jgi:hypothetical protein